MNPDRYIFGYGSLVSPRSVARSLSRAIDPAMLPEVVLRDHQRDWALRIPVLFNDSYDSDALLLDVSARAGRSLSGVLVPVTGPELAVFSRREAQYQAVEFTSLIDSAAGASGIGHRHGNPGPGSAPTAAY